MNLQKKLISLLIFFSFLLLSFYPLKLTLAQRVDGELVVKMAAQSLKIEGSNYLGLFYQNNQDWHTYWKYPGDAGTPFINTFTLDGQQVELESLEWPVPKRFYAEGDVVGYGYAGTYGIFYKIPTEMKGQLSIDSKWLACKERCIPGEKSLTGTISDALFYSETGSEFLPTEDEIQKTFNDIPKEIPLPESFTYSLIKEDDNQLSFFYSLKDHSAQNINLKKNFILPFPHPYFTFGHEELFYSPEAVFGKIRFDYEGQYLDLPVEFPQDGHFAEPIQLSFLINNPETNQSSVIKLTFDKFQLEGLVEQNELIKTLLPIDWKHPENNPIEKNIKQERNKLEEGDEATESLKSEQPSFSSMEKREDMANLFLSIFLALIGGLILNFMPCVLPVISIKLFGLIRHQNQPQKIVLKHNLFYTLGILFSFSLLSLVVIILQLSGEQIGWGFHLQSPTFVALMVLIVFILTLNLFGLFEFTTPGGRGLASIQIEGVWGDFFNGILAVILSTPCSAPFLGTALTFAFSSPWYIVFIVFMSIGLGLAFPFILTGLFPKTIRIFPKPGPWMDHLKKFLGLTLLLTTVWLADVLSELLNSTELLLKINISLSLIFFAFYFQQKIGKKLFFKLLFFTLATLFSIQTLWLIKNHTPSSISKDQESEITSTPSNSKTGKNLWISWSKEKMEQFKQEEKSVFIDFTANWCFTCKVNEKLVLETEEFQQITQEFSLALLKGDWTKRDESITQFLKSQGVVGVPAYFIQTPKGELINLGELINIKKIREALVNIK